MLWLICVAWCDAEQILGWCHHHGADSHEHSVQQAVTTHNEHGHSPEGKGQRDGEADHSRAAEGNSRDSHPHDGKGDHCCSTIKAIVQPSEPVMLSKPAFPPAIFLCFLIESHHIALRPLGQAPDRQTKSRFWVFTPEVHLGPAFRSHAPPCFHVI